MTASAIRGLCAWAGALWAAVPNDAAGRLELHRYDGRAWSQPHYVGVADRSGAVLTIRLPVPANANRLDSAA